MKRIHLLWLVPALMTLTAIGEADPGGTRDLQIHLAQANNDSPYSFVRAKFEPGEVANPWAVRFFDEAGKEVPYFVWDSVSWRVAREGREDWGKRFALINHAPGDAPEARKARAQKIEWAKARLPELAAKLEAEDQAAERNPDSMCAVMYLLRYHVPAFGKPRLTMRIFPTAQFQPDQKEWKGAKVEERVSIRQGDLEMSGLPDRTTVTWKGKEIFHYAGFNAGNAAGQSSHADPSRPFTIEKTGGLITKVHVTGQTDGRNGAPMDWQCTYWLLPEGGYVGLEGFNMGDPAGYKGGPQKLSIWQAPAEFSEVHKPSWDAPWWLHQVGSNGFVSTHLLYAPSLATGYGNNPYTINAEGNGKEPDMELTQDKVALAWSYQLNDPSIARVQSPEPVPQRGQPAEAAPASVEWKPKIDWLYREYLVGVGENAGSSESALRGVLGAAAGWVDRPIDEEKLAATIVEIIKRMPVDRSGTEFDQLIVAAILEDGDVAAAKNYLSRARNQSEKADFYMALMREFVARGGKPAGGSHIDPDGVRREGFTGNPCYFAHLLPAYLRVFDFFELHYPREQYRQALTRFADFTEEFIGGKPFSLDQWNTTLEEQWPSRVVPAIPLMIGANAERPDKQYSQAATILFDDLWQLVERNPHGYFPVWTFHPKADRWDTVYNPVSYSRGLSSFWTEEKLDWIGRERASKFVAAQVRWMVFSDQLLDTLETDNVCAIRAATHHGHTNSRTQLGLYLLDDFEFYRGLVGGVVDWSAAAWQDPEPLFPIGTGPYRSLTIETPILRWALDIRPGGKWLEHQVEPLPAQHGFKVLAWNRLAAAKPTVSITGKEIGLASPDEMLRIELPGPSYRVPTELSFTRDHDKAMVKVTKPARVHLAYRALWPELSASAKPILRQRKGDGTLAVVTDAKFADEGSIEWNANEGEYELGGR
jgi:hypothetical protein